MKRAAYIKRSRIKPKRRTAAEQRAERERTYGPPGFVEWIQALPSVASGKGPCVAAHTKTGGVSRKGDWTSIVPLTDHEHRVELHQELGQRSFEAKYQIDLEACAAATQAAWRERMEATG